MTLTINAQIDASPDVRAGKPCVAGTRIAVHDVVLSHVRLGHSAEEVAASYRLPMSAVYAALAYYYEHRERIDAEMEAEDEAVEKMIAAAPPSRFQQKLAELKQTDEWKRA